MWEYFMTVVVGGPVKTRRGFQSFENCTNGGKVSECLKRVLSKTGNAPKTDKKLYHYTSIGAAVSILRSGYLWLSSPDTMNDTLERACVKQSMPNLYFTSFSHSEENMGIYSMYARGSEGVMMRITFEAAEQLLSSLPITSRGRKQVHIVRNNELTDTVVEADVYWRAVCYKQLRSNTLAVGTVSNSRIAHPLAEPKLAGFVKLYGWEYEKEVRLCAVTHTPLNPNEKVAVPIPKNWEVSVVTKPGFNRKSNEEACMALTQYDVRVSGSSYEGLVNIAEP